MEERERKKEGGGGSMCEVHMYVMFGLLLSAEMDQ